VPPQLRRRLRRSLAVVQRGRSTDSSAVGIPDRAGPPHDQRITSIAILLLLVWVFRGTLAGHLARITGSWRRCSSSTKRCWAPCLFCAADGRQPLSARAVYLSLHPAILCCCWGTRALCALPLRRRNLPSPKRAIFATARRNYRARGHPARGHERDAGCAQRHALSCYVGARRTGRGFFAAGPRGLQQLRFSPRHRGDCRASLSVAAAAQRSPRERRQLAIGVLSLLGLQCLLGLRTWSCLLPCGCRLPICS